MNKLLVFTENHVRGGGNRYMIDLINALGPNYDAVEVLSNTNGIFPQDVKRLNDHVSLHTVFFFNGSSINRLSSQLPRVMRWGLSLLLIVLEPVLLILNIALFLWNIQRIKPSMVISCNGGYPAARACLAMVVAASIMRTPVILSIVSMPMSRKPYMQLYERILDKYVWKSVDSVIVNAQSIAQALSHYRGMSPEKVKVILNGVKDQNIYISPKSKGDEFVIGCVARMDTAKGVLFLLEAFAHLSRKYDHLRLVLIGSGDASQELEKQTINLGLQDRVTLVGHYEGDINELVETFDLYVFPSLWEGMPYSIIEAMCSARTIITTKVGGIPEIINDGVEGLLVTPGSTVELIAAIERLINNDKQRHALATNARKKFQEQLTLDHMKLRIQNSLLSTSACASSIARKA